jgi:hypothetical protein
MIQRGSQVLIVSLPFPFFVIFRTFSWQCSCGGFDTFLLGIWWGMYAWTLCGSFPFDSPPKSVSKGAQCWVFLCSRVRGVLDEISSIPLNLASFGGPNLGYGVPMRCSYYPQSLVWIRGANWEIKVWIWGNWPWVAVHPKLPRLDRCSWPVWSVQGPCGICSGKLPDLRGFGLWCCWLVVGMFQGVLLGFVKVFLFLQFDFRWFLFQGLEESLRLHETFLCNCCGHPAWPALSTGLTRPSVRPV